MLTLLFFALGLAALAAVAAAARDWSMRRRALERLYADAAQDAASATQEETTSALSLWLVRAGYRRPNARAIFLAATAVCIAVGIVVSQFYRTFLAPALLQVLFDGDASRYASARRICIWLGTTHANTAWAWERQRSEPFPSRYQPPCTLRYAE